MSLQLPPAALRKLEQTLAQWRHWQDGGELPGAPHLVGQLGGISNYTVLAEAAGQRFCIRLDRVNPAANSLNRQVLIDQIIDVMINLKGEIKQKAKDLYLSLGLKKDSMVKARSRKWHLKIKGYRELAFMDIRDANEHIIRSLESNNEILRMEAQIALVRLSPLLFFTKAKQATSLTRRDALETYYLSVVLGFRGMYRDPSAAFLAEQLELPQTLEAWASQTARSIQLGQGRPPIAESRRAGEGAPPLEGKFSLIGMSLLMAILAAVAAMMAWFIFGPQ